MNRLCCYYWWWHGLYTIFTIVCALYKRMWAKVLEFLFLFHFYHKIYLIIAFHAFKMRRKLFACARPGADAFGPALQTDPQFIYCKLYRSLFIRTAYTEHGFLFEDGHFSVNINYLRSAVCSNQIHCRC